MVERRHLWTCSYHIWLHVTCGLCVSLGWCFVFLQPALPPELPERGCCVSFWCFLQFTSKIQWPQSACLSSLCPFRRASRTSSFSFARLALGCRWRRALLSLSSLWGGAGRSLPPAVSTPTPGHLGQKSENSPGWIHASQEPLQSLLPSGAASNPGCRCPHTLQMTLVGLVCLASVDTFSNRQKGVPGELGFSLWALHSCGCRSAGPTRPTPSPTV